MERKTNQVNRMLVIIGGMVLDVHATPSVEPERESTTPGKIEFVHGGVARNIAECLIKLGTKPYMISAVGSKPDVASPDSAVGSKPDVASPDSAGEMLLELWKSSGLPIEGIQISIGVKTAVVSQWFHGGKLMEGIADVDIIERHVTPQWIQQQCRPSICSVPVMMVDANLSIESLTASCQLAAEFDVPVWFEPVSVTKSKRVASVAKYITFASPNELEVVAMADALGHRSAFDPSKWKENKDNGSIESLFKELKSAIVVLLDKGIKFVLVTIGSRGAILCSRLGPSCLEERIIGAKIVRGRNKFFDAVSGRCPTPKHTNPTLHKRGSQLFAMHFPALPAKVGRVSGAGDCLVGGVLSSLCSGLNLMQSVAVGIAAAKASILVKANVPHQFDFIALADDAVAVYNAARVVFQESQL